MKRNAEVRERARAYYIKLWEVAEELGTSDSALSRKLRHELSGEEKERVLRAIDRLRERREQK